MLQKKIILLSKLITTAEWRQNISFWYFAVDFEHIVTLTCVRNCSLERVIPLPVGIYLLKVKYGNTRTRCVCSKLTIKTPERCQWCRSVVFIVNFEHISHLVLVFLLLIWTCKCRLGLIGGKRFCFKFLQYGSWFRIPKTNQITGNIAVVGIYWLIQLQSKS